MRILLVNWNDRDNPHAGGAEVHLHEIFGRLVDRGHVVDLVASGWAGASPRASVDGISVHRIGGRYSFALLARGALRMLLQRRPFDVVIEDMNKVPLFLAGMTGLPLGVIVPHLFGTTVFREAAWPLAALVWAAEQRVPRAYGRAWFHAISESTRDDLVRRGVARERITVIYPGVDAGWYAPDPATPRTSRPTFLYVGRLKRYKGVEFALRALAEVRRQGVDAELDVAGQGDDRRRLEGVAHHLGIGRFVRFLGFVSQDEKRNLLRRAWATVFPSPKEGWGLTNVEAAACGTPALASDSPGLRESVRHGETGFLVPHGDWRALAGRMRELALNPVLVTQLGRSAREFATGLSWDRAARETEAHLERIVAGGA